MLDNNLATKVDLTLVDEVEKMVRNTAQLICAEQPDVPEPQTLHDLDSFSMVQILLELENTTGMKLLEKFEDFKEGETFRDLATFIVGLAAEGDEETGPGEDTGETKRPETSAATADKAE